MPGRPDEILPPAPRPDGRAFSGPVEKMAGLGHQRRSRLRQGFPTRMAPRVVWHQGLFPLARIQGLQNARPRAALALPLLSALPRLPRRALSARNAAL